MITPVDLWAAAAVAVAGASIAVRARMLRPRQQAWTVAPALVWGSLTVLGVAALMASADIIWGGRHATAREAMIYTVLAVTGLAMVWNLHRNGRAVGVRRREVEAEVRQVMDLSGAPAVYPWERRP